MGADEPPPVIVKVAAGEVPPEVVTVMLAVPTAAIRLAGTAAVNWLAFTKVVVSVVFPHCTVAPLVKLFPFTTNVNPAAPAVTVLGFRLVIAGSVSRVMVAVADLVESATLIAVTVTVCCVVMLAGAV